MNALVTRMAGMRQGVGLAVAAVALVYFAQEWLTKGTSIPFALPQLLLGVAISVWAIEEHFRGNRGFTVLFSALGVALSGYALYLLFR